MACATRNFHANRKEKKQVFTIHLEFIEIETGQVKFTLAPAKEREDIFTAPRTRIGTCFELQIRLLNKRFFPIIKIKTNVIYTQSSR